MEYHLLSEDFLTSTVTVQVLSFTSLKSRKILVRVDKVGVLDSQHFPLRVHYAKGVGVDYAQDV